MSAALPTLSSQLMQVKISTVMKNTHICLAEDKHNYCVPYQFIGKKVKVLYNDDRVEIFYRYHRIAQHKRDSRKQEPHLGRPHDHNPMVYVSKSKSEFFYNKWFSY